MTKEGELCQSVIESLCIACYYIRVACQGGCYVTTQQ